MKKSAIWIVLLALGSAPAAADPRPHEPGDKSIVCLDPNTCKGSAKPPSCCKPPPCVFFRQIKMKTILQSMFASNRLRSQAMAKAGGKDSAAAYGALNDLVFAAARQGGPIDKQLPACPGEDAIKDPPTISTTPECTRTDGTETLSENQANQKYATCTEFLDAIYRHEDLHKERCGNQDSTVRKNASMTESANEEVSGYEKEIAALRGDLQKWYDGCTTAVDAETAKKLAAAGVTLVGGKK